MDAHSNGRSLLLMRFRVLLDFQSDGSSVRDPLDDFAHAMAAPGTEIRNQRRATIAVNIRETKESLGCIFDVYIVPFRE